MITVGIRQLRDRLSHYLRRVKAGERLVITERGKSVAVLSPSAGNATDQRVEAMLREGLACWGGGKPRGSPRPARVKGPSVAQAVIEGRR
ncbi:MAG: type II toxin-antitoxin system prevent-host-death family antitoxin [Candidatus Tectomicrobia bacterium]|uniref:Antitoxin n=1 Tax=Tectimicrobiota bacterium TaxID=2528274 RepID=A0A932GQB4_UNCTE|nr:type II toxin-antitoxin system prevent-host-death family antitoxin [Candidatus Tectomicrobia bacterium]